MHKLSVYFAIISEWKSLLLSCVCDMEQVHVINSPVIVNVSVIVSSG